MRRWVLAAWPDLENVERLVAQFGLPPELAALYWRRGFISRAELEPPLAPPKLPGLNAAAARIVAAIEKGERIRIHGDYDADGVSAAALLVLGLAELGAEVHAFIPHRLHDGYGLSMERVPEHVEAADLLITVDCGISNHRELGAIAAAGVSIIVTDHHHVGEQKPPGVVVHPAFSPELEGVPWPTGSGVAFFLLWAVRKALGQAPPLEYADLASIGTVADVVPLLGVNRALVRAGLARMKNSPHVGLRVLAERHCQRCTASEVAFRIAPRINAAGRLGEAETALEALTTSSYVRALELADRLDELNRERQQIEEEMLQRVLPTLDESAPALVIHDPEGHPGVMGIVASRVLERYYKPVFIMARGRGSVRSVPGVSAVAALAAAAEHLKGYGGHEGAAGFSIEPDRVEGFRSAIYEFVASQAAPRPALVLDAVLSAEETPELYRGQQLLEPFGQGNPEPVYYVTGTPERIRPLAGGKHVSFSLGGLRVIKWKDGGESLLEGEPLDVAASLVENEWQGLRSFELRALAYRPADWLECEGESSLRVIAQEPRRAMAEALERRLPVYASGAGVEYLRERGLSLAAAEEAEVWFAVPERPIKREEVRLAVSDVTFARLLQPQSIAALQRLLKGQEEPQGEPAIALQAELGGELSADALARSSAYRRWRMALAALKRLRLAYERGTPECLGVALEMWWRVAARLQNRE